MGCFVWGDKSGMRCLSGVAEMAWDVCLGWQKWHEMFCLGWQKWHGVFCQGWQKRHGMFCPGWHIFVGCFGRGSQKKAWDVLPGMF